MTRFHSDEDEEKTSVTTPMVTFAPIKLAIGSLRQIRLLPSPSMLGLAISGTVAGTKRITPRGASSAVHGHGPSGVL